MSNYTQIVAYGPKDTLTLNDANKFIKGVQFDGEFQAIATAIASKIDAAFTNPTVKTLTVTDATVPTYGIYNPGASFGISTGSVARVLVDGNGTFQVFPTTGNISGTIQPAPSLLGNGPIVSTAAQVTGANSGVAKTLFTMPTGVGTQQAYIVSVTMPTAQDAVNYSSTSLVFANASTARIVPLSTSSSLTLSLSGLSVQASQNSGNNAQVLFYTTLRLM